VCSDVSSAGGSAASRDVKVCVWGTQGWWCGWLWGGGGVEQLGSRCGQASLLCCLSPAQWLSACDTCVLVSSAHS
jgi:hypothetical protein